MDAQELLDKLSRYLNYCYGTAKFDCQPPRHDPRRIGPFGAILTDRHTQAVMLDGERFFVTVEKDPNQ